MKMTKYVYSGGLAFTEASDMKKLSKHARKGWLLESFAPFGYTLRKGEPQNLIYSVDYQEDADADYFALFEEAGWKKVCSAGGESAFHIFSAPPGTRPIYTDQDSLIERYERERKMSGKVALPLLIVTIVLLLVRIISGYGWLPETLGQIGLFAGLASFILLIFPGFPYISYTLKLNRYRSGKKAV
ncbi:DUF2812 domain-containing protein [Paenibacillus sp. 1011MAR3C5]|uniref:DUF2812 domain-containing protein n=1 Tax=Paenibacillus sp. 1011MAR3C5 TaxID=1675787 RepID=UPI000E6BF18C|nr:DUF2812 domain-containing protein [Paenibacillus sp. 1011MAR3C5]RJE85182.1 DUF2812 domain-containing protein [Paenibacillus sp. 1011MAR3C5]